MTFITPEDYSVQVREEILKMLDSDNSALEIAERMAIDQIKKYIGTRLDTEAIFSKTGDDRDFFIVMIVIDMALYHLWSKKAPRSIPEFRKERYGDALEWLTGVANGSITMPDIPQVEQGNIKISSVHKPNDNKF